MPLAKILGPVFAIGLAKGCDLKSAPSTPMPASASNRPACVRCQHERCKILARAVLATAGLRWRHGHMAAIMRSESWARAERAVMQARSVAPAMARAKARAAAIPAAAVLDQVRAAAKARAMRAVGRALPAARPAAAEVTASRDSLFKYRPKRYLTGAAIGLCRPAHTGKSRM